MPHHPCSLQNIFPCLLVHLTQTLEAPFWSHLKLLVCKFVVRKTRVFCLNYLFPWWWNTCHPNSPFFNFTQASFFLPVMIPHSFAFCHVHVSHCSYQACFFQISHTFSCSDPGYLGYCQAQSSCSFSSTELALLSLNDTRHQSPTRNSIFGVS